MNEASIRLHIEPLDEGGFLATSPDIPGLVAEGRSITEATEIAQGLARKIAESCIEHGDPLPRALARRTPESIYWCPSACPSGTAVGVQIPRGSPPAATIRLHIRPSGSREP